MYFLAKQSELACAFLIFAQVPDCELAYLEAIKRDKGILGFVAVLVGSFVFGPAPITTLVLLLSIANFIVQLVNDISNLAQIFYAKPVFIEWIVNQVDSLDEIHNHSLILVRKAHADNRKVALYLFIFMDSETFLQFFLALLIMLQSRKVSQLLNKLNLQEVTESNLIFVLHIKHLLNFLDNLFREYFIPLMGKLFKHFILNLQPDCVIIHRNNIVVILFGFLVVFPFNTSNRAMIHKTQQNCDD